jgi:DNA-binding winged helix-turn-helix (wHTH) protein/Tol biopolymer transport system component
MALSSNEVCRFDEFELDPSRRAFERNGVQVPLSPRAFEVLKYLVNNPGRVVPKEEIFKAVWPESFVEESNLTQHISALRKALGDRAHYIATIPGRGYQFTAKVLISPPPEISDNLQAGEILVQRVRERTQVVIEESLPAPVLQPAAPFVPPLPRRIQPWVAIAIAACALVIVFLAGLGYWLVARANRSATLRVSNYFQITRDGRDKYLAGTDGSRLYFTQRSPHLAAQVGESGGVVVPVSLPLADSWLGGVSPDGSTILLVAEAGGMTSAESLWSVNLLGGSHRRLTEAVTATWSPDGQSVAYATQEGDICLIASDGSQPRKLVSVGGFIGSLAWSPDGALIRFSKAGKLWEITSKGDNLHPLLTGWRDSVPKSSGVYGPDGSFYFVSDGQIYTFAEHRRLFGKPIAEPAALTSGPVRWSAPIPSRNGKKLFAVGATRRGELVAYDRKSSQFQPFLGGISAEFIAFSPDGKSVAYVTYPEGVLWRANLDGSMPVQLTIPPVYPKAPRWSPDGKQILFVDHSSQGPSAIFLIPAEGGSVPQRLLPEDRDAETDPTWSPDGKRVAYSTSPEEFTNPKPVLRILDLATHQVTTVPGSNGLFSPRWSPDGRSLAASTLDSLSMKVFDFATQQWTQLQTGAVAFPEWSHDSRSLYYASWASTSAILRISSAGGKPERVASLKGEQYTGVYTSWMGLAPDDTPLMLRDRGSNDIYALTLEGK